MRHLLLTLLVACGPKATAPDAFGGTPVCTAELPASVEHDNSGVVRLTLDTDQHALPGPITELLDCCDHAEILVRFPQGSYRLRIDGAKEGVCQFTVQTILEDGAPQTWTCADNEGSSWEVWSDTTTGAPSVAAFRSACEAAP